MFLKNHSGNTELSLFATCRSATTINVQNPLTGYSQTRHISAGQSAFIFIPSEHGQTPADYAVHSTALKVTSSTNISLYASNFMDYTFDITSVLPSGALDTDYMAQTYSGTAGDECEVGILATQDSTILTITQPDGTEILDLNGQRYVLMAAQTLQLTAPIGYNSFGFSGLRVVSNGKPFAMFQGNQCTYVPAGYSACDHLYEQCLPTMRWGKNFVVVPTANRNGLGERIRVTSLYDNCVVTYNDSTSLLHAGGTAEFVLPPGGAKTLTTSKKATVCIYLSGISYGGDPGDPAMVLVPPLEQGVKSATFYAINTDVTTDHFTNIVVASRYAPYMMLDTTNISSVFTPIGNGYSYAQLAVQPGSHTLHTDTGRFTAHFYGLGEAESYAYVAGMGLRITDNRMLVNGIDDLTSNRGVSVCMGDSVNLEFSSPDTNITFGWYVNGEFLANNRRNLRYVFDSVGVNEVMTIIYNLCDTLTTYVTVNPSYFNLTADTVCENIPYQWRGQTLVGGGLFTDTLPSSLGCDSIMAIQLKRTAFAHPRILVDNNCSSRAYHLVAQFEDSTLAGFLRWASIPNDSAVNSADGRMEIHVAPSIPTTYSLTLNIDCSDTGSITLSPITIPQAAMNVTPELIDYDHTLCTAIDISKFGTDRLWLVNGVEAGSDPTLRTFADLHADSLALTLVEFNNYCTDTAFRTIPVSRSLLWAPNTFTPQNDDNNRFYVTTSDDIEPLWLYIYNREGLLVFSTDSPDQGWDGTRNGTPVPQGAYVWKLVYMQQKRSTGTLSSVGTVTLLR